MAYGQRGTQEGSSNEIAQGYFHSHITLYCHAMYLTKNSYKFKLNRYNKSWSKKIWMFLYITHHLHLKLAFLCREIFFLSCRPSEAVKPCTFIFLNSHFPDFYSAKPYLLTLKTTPHIGTHILGTLSYHRLNYWKKWTLIGNFIQPVWEESFSHSTEIQTATGMNQDTFEI